MIAEITSNSIMMFAFAICLLFTIGDVDQVINTPTKLPVIEIYYQATKNKAAATILVFFPIFIMFVSLINIYASVSRLVWSFATDKGLPFSSYFARVSTKYFSRPPIICSKTDLDM